MLKCKDIASHASDYQEKQMSFGGRMQFAMHLLICGKCREFVRQVAKAMEVCRMKDQLEDKVLQPDEASHLAGQIISHAEHAEDQNDAKD